MTFNQILKEFDECEHLETGVCDMNVAKSFLKQSFIKYLQSEVERLQGEMFADVAEAGQFAMHSGGYNQALEDQITHINNLLETFLTP